MHRPTCTYCESTSWAAEREPWVCENVQGTHAQAVTVTNHCVSHALRPYTKHFHTAYALHNVAYRIRRVVQA